MATKADPILENESGSALVIALIMMVVLTIIGLASSYTSIFEIKLSGNQRGSTDAFYAADAGINEITTNIANFDLTNSITGKPNYDPVKNTYYPFSDPTNVTPNPTNVVATNTYLPTVSGPPRGTGFSAINLGYAYYQIQCSGHDQASSLASESTTTIQEEVVRLLPLP